MQKFISKFKTISKTSIVLPFLLVLTFVGYQNCGKSFKSLESGSTVSKVGQGSSCPLTTGLGSSITLESGKSYKDTWDSEEQSACPSGQAGKVINYYTNTRKSICVNGDLTVDQSRTVRQAAVNSCTASPLTCTLTASLTSGGQSLLLSPNINALKTSIPVYWSVRIDTNTTGSQGPFEYSFFGDDLTAASGHPDGYLAGNVGTVFTSTVAAPGNFNRYVQVKLPSGAFARCQNEYKLSYTAPAVDPNQLSCTLKAESQDASGKYSPITNQDAKIQVMTPVRWTITTNQPAGLTAAFFGPDLDPTNGYPLEGVTPVVFTSVVSDPTTKYTRFAKVKTSSGKWETCLPTYTGSYFSPPPSAALTLDQPQDATTSGDYSYFSLYGLNWPAPVWSSSNNGNWYPWPAGIWLQVSGVNGSACGPVTYGYDGFSAGTQTRQINMRIPLSTISRECKMTISYAGQTVWKTVKIPALVPQHEVPPPPTSGMCENTACDEAVLAKLKQQWPLTEAIWQTAVSREGGRIIRLQLYGRSLSGSFPNEIVQLSNLQDLSLYNNNLTGVIPSQLGDLSKLKYLYLRGNSFSNCVPFALKARLVDSDIDVDSTAPNFCDN